MLAVLNQAKKGLETVAHVLGFGDGAVAKKLRFAKLIAPMHALSLFRLGREEAADDLLDLAMQQAYRQVGWPFSAINLLPLCQRKCYAI